MSMQISASLRKFCLAGAICLSGCASVGPDYATPQVGMADHWQAALPHGGQGEALLGWWARFDDPVLATLLARAEADSPTLAEAVGRIDEARAGLTQAESGHLPVIDSSVNSLRNGVRDDLPVATQTTRRAALDASWEIDVFGRVRRTNEAASARLTARQDAWHEARVSLAAEVARKYVDYRACQLLSRAFGFDAQSRAESARLVDLAARTGFSAPADAQLARASHADAAGQFTAQQARCDIGIKSLVTLTGFAEDELRTLLGKGRGAIPQPPPFAVAGLPVALLAQRPDLAASERELAAASADIGVASAERYPRLSLLGSVAREKTRAGGTTISSAPWSFGPALTLPIFHGGALAAQQEEAEARHAQALARYRKAVRVAVEEVEIALVNLDSASRRAGDAHTATTGYRAYFTATETNWRAGGLSLLSLEEARRAATAAERAEIVLQRDHVLYWIDLYKALGGGWDGHAEAHSAPSAAPINPTIPTTPAHTANIATDSRPTAPGETQ